MSTVYLDGAYLPLAAAKVPVMDRGFLFGDGIYEVIPVYSRRPFRLDEHLARLQSSLDGIRLANPHAPDAWRHIIDRIVAAAEWADQSLYIQVTRGPMALRNHVFPATVTPTVFVMAEALAPPPPELRRRGIAAISAADIRWLRCDLKATSLLANCLLRQLSADAGCAETILLRDGFLTEGAASSIFIVKDGTLAVPPKSHLMLPGITYDIVLELAAAHGLAHAVRAVTEAELRSADEIWMCSSTKEVLPVVMLDGRPVGAGKPGPCAAAMHGWYLDFKTTVMRKR